MCESISLLPQQPPVSGTPPVESLHLPRARLERRRLGSVYAALRAFDHDPFPQRAWRTPGDRDVRGARRVRIIPECLSLRAVPRFRSRVYGGTRQHHSNPLNLGSRHHRLVTHGPLRATRARMAHACTTHAAYHRLSTTTLRCYRAIYHCDRSVGGLMVYPTRGPPPESACPRRKTTLGPRPPNVDNY